jgi:hypothetical protein
MSDVELLRQQLRERGYLSHGIERWFALDPWSSRTFWQELLLVAAKAAALIALFGALPPAVVMLVRNYPLQVLETAALYLSYASASFVWGFVFVILAALIIKVRPALPIDTPRALLAISLGSGAILLTPFAFWWWRFDTAPSLAELLAGGSAVTVAFLFFSLVVSAALLSFSIHELHRIPTLHQRSRGAPMGVAAAVLIAMLFVPAMTEREDASRMPPMVVTSPTTIRVALIAVDGLTWEIVQSRPDLIGTLPYAYPLEAAEGDSAAERWASLGTGVSTADHGVRAIEGVRFRGGSHIIQQISRADVVLLDATPLLGLARREPLPPTVRRRDYVWEILASRGVSAAAVNWWTTADSQEGILQVAGPESIFSEARGEPLRLDLVATSRLFQLVERHQPRFTTVYLPALDVILNRIPMDRSAQLTASIQALDGVVHIIALMKAHGYEIVVAGLPGERQSGAACLGATIPLDGAVTSWDLAPTLLDLFRFPASQEMAGHSRLSEATQPRIRSYGSRVDPEGSPVMNPDYYENLRSLGYIR